MDTLVVVAHPDDEAIGCGGSISRFSDEGQDVAVVLPLRRCDRRGVENWERLTAAFRASCMHLGAIPIILDPLLDEVLAETHVHQLHDMLCPWIEQSDCVLTHWWGDVNQVHRGVYRAVEIAARPFRRRKHVYLFETASSTDQVFQPTFAPNAYSILNEASCRRKCEAMGFYETEQAFGRRPEDLERKLRVRGVEVGVDYAEAFVVGRVFL